MKLGTIVKLKYFNGVADQTITQKYQQNLIKYFSEVGMYAFGQMPFVAQNGPDPNKDYKWENIDSLIKFAQENTLSVHYNSVIMNYGDNFPEWYKKLNPNEKKRALKQHVKGIVNRYKGKISWYKLVNEVLQSEDDNFLGTNENKIDLIAKMFQWAKEEDKESTFIINEFGTFVRDDLKNGYVGMINKILQAGGPIDAIGIEGHLGHPSVNKNIKPFRLPANETIGNTLDEIYNLTKLPIYITEFDLSYDNSCGKPYLGSKVDPSRSFSDDGKVFNNWFEYQAFSYKRFCNLCSKKDYVENLTFWGFYDEDESWERKGTGFFDKTFKPKPVFDVMQKILGNLKET
jgi:GH35 family endo-1,4-beta-xylanase